MIVTSSGPRSHVVAMRLVKTRVTIPVAPDSAPFPIGELCRSPHDAITALHALIGDDASECIVAVLIDTRHRIIGYHEVARGTVNACRLSPRDVLIPALLANAAALILAHNHPSGDPTPSLADRHITTQLQSACRTVGIKLLDHVIVTSTAHHSFYASDGSSEAELPPA